MTQQHPAKWIGLYLPPTRILESVKCTQESLCKHQRAVASPVAALGGCCKAVLSVAVGARVKVLVPSSFFLF